MRTFKVGDRVVIVRSDWPNRIGEVTSVKTVIDVGAEGFTWLKRVGSEEVAPGTTMYELTTPTNSDRPSTYGVCYPATHLEPLPDDSVEKGEWTDELRRLCRLGVKETT